MRVVKRTEFGQPGEYNAQQRESFWYCAGPDAQYYLAIVQANYRPFPDIGVQLGRAAAERGPHAQCVAGRRGCDGARVRDWRGGLTSFAMS